MGSILIKSVLFSVYVTVSLITGKLVFKMLSGCENIVDYLFYGLVSIVWIGFLLLGWILLINYINEKRDI